MGRFCIITFILIISIFSGWARPFRIVGYLPTYRFESLEAIEIEKLTHLIIAFGQPSQSGAILLEKNYQAVIERCKMRNTDLKILISLGGGGISNNLMNSWRYHMRPENSPYFIGRILEFLSINNLDGVDMDLEWNNVTPEYPAFIRQLSDSLRSHQYVFSGAFPAMKKYQVMTNEDYGYFDFLNIMAYDNAGPWQPTVIRQHSSLSLAENALQFWTHTVGIPKENLNLGMPCYGYDFACSPVKGKTFASMVQEDREFAFEDNISKTYYNSIPTIISKTRLARQNSGGVMLWELGQDALAEQGDFSLLHYVYNTVLNDNGQFFPDISKFSVSLDKANFMNIILPKSSASDSYFVLQDLTGCTYEKLPFSSYSRSVNLDFNSYCDGIYFLTLVEPGSRPVTQRVMKL